MWHNDAATTWRIGPASAPLRYLKVARPPGAVLGGALDLAGEARRLRWIGDRLPVPEVLAVGPVPDGAGQWMLTAALPGTHAIAPAHRERPEQTVATLGTALRRFHDTLPVAECPWTWSPAEQAVDHPDHRVRELAATAPAVAPRDRVVCCGDACAPNVLLDDAGRLVGYVDLGDLGVGDRWADLAVALLSLGWNYGHGWDRTYLEAYGIDPDPERISFHQTLHQLT